MRFAPIIRVSTETQEKKGESLSTQKKQIIQYVKTLNGTIPDDCWQYCGQEHATVGEGRKKLEQLLTDSGKDRFDAVIVCDASRWSRDNAKNKAGLEILRKNSIRFFIGTSEYDLFDPQARLFLGMSTEMNEYFGMEQARKSLINRIERAKKGWPTCGMLPYGRTFDKNAGKWGVDESKRDQIKMIAGQYVKGIPARELAARYGLHYITLLKYLRERCGPVWMQTFRSKRLNIYEEIHTEVPALLSDAMIKKVHERAKSNRTWAQGERKNKYLLGGFVFCEHCGYVLGGQAAGKINDRRYRYYRHPYRSEYRYANACDRVIAARAGQLEEVVLLNLFKLYGDQNYLEKAMARAIPNKERLERLRQEHSDLTKRYKQIQSKIDNVIDAIAEGIITKDQAKKKMQDYNKQCSIIDDRLGQIDAEVGNMPTKNQIEGKAKLLNRIHRQIAHTPEHLAKMSYNDKRKLVESVFDGKDVKGNRLGVYVKKDGKEVTFTINGQLADLQFKGKLPLSEDDWVDLLGLDPNYQDIAKEIEVFKSYIPSSGQALPQMSDPGEGKMAQ